MSNSQTPVEQEIKRFSNLMIALLKITGEAKTLEEAKKIAADALAEDSNLSPPGTSTIDLSD